MKRSELRISKPFAALLIAACCFSLTTNQAYAQQAATFDSLQRTPWIKGCDWSGSSGARVASLIENAVEHFENGAQVESRKALMEAADIAANAFSLNQKLSHGVCIAETQVRVGFSDDARATLRKTFLAARHHWKESEPHSISAHTTYISKLAYFQFELEDFDHLKETFAFVESELALTESGLDTVYAYMILAQSLLVTEHLQRAEAAFASAREIILNTGGDIQDSLLDADTPNAGILMSELAWHEAQVGLFDLALNDLNSARGLASAQDPCVRDILLQTEKQLLDVRNGEAPMQVMKSQDLPISCRS